MVLLLENVYSRECLLRREISNTVSLDFLNMARYPYFAAARPVGPAPMIAMFLI